MCIDLEAYLLAGISIGLVYESTRLNKHIITLDLLVLRLIVSVVRESTQSSKH
jgi:hypothetical protein